MEKNLYEELGLKKNATKSEIKSSYRSLVKQHHPDAGGEKERFLAIQNAWETLNDPIKKEKYDRKFFSFNTSSNSLNESNDKLDEKKFLSYCSFLIGSFSISHAFCIARKRSFSPPASG